MRDLSGMSYRVREHKGHLPLSLSYFRLVRISLSCARYDKPDRRSTLEPIPKPRQIWRARCCACSVTGGNAPYRLQIDLDCPSPCPSPARVRQCARAGELLRDMDRAKPGQPKKNSNVALPFFESGSADQSLPDEDQASPPTLAQLGISKQQYVTILPSHDPNAYRGPSGSHSA